MGRIAKNYFYNIAFQFLVLITPVITAPYLARVLGATNLGICSYVTSSGNLITMMALLGIFAYGSRQVAYIRDNRLELTNVFWEIIGSRVFLGLFGTLFYGIYAWFNHSYTLFFLIYYPYILAEFFDCSWLFVGVEDMKPTALKNIFARLTNVIGIFAFVRSKEDIWVYLLLQALTLCVANLSIWLQISKYVNRPHKGLFKKYAYHIFHSLRLFLPQFAALMYLQMDKVMLQWITHETSQVAFYDQAEKLIKIPLTFITVLSTVMMPRIANQFRKNDVKGMEKYLLRAGNISLLLAFPMMFGLFIVSRQLIPWYLGEEFLPTAYGMMILAPIVILNSLEGISGRQYFTATDQIAVLLKAYVSAAVLNLVGNMILIPHYGYVGAAIASVSANLLAVLIQYSELRKQMDLSPLIRDSMCYGLGAILMAFCIWLAFRHLPAKPMTTVMQFITGSAVYFLFLLSIRDPLVQTVFNWIRDKERK